MEAEADRMGFRYLINSGVDPEGLISFFAKLGKEAENHG